MFIHIEEQVNEATKPILIIHKITSIMKISKKKKEKKELALNPKQKGQIATIGSYMAPRDQQGCRYAKYM